MSPPDMPLCTMIQNITDETVKETSDSAQAQKCPTQNTNNSQTDTAHENTSLPIMTTTDATESPEKAITEFSHDVNQNVTRNRVTTIGNSVASSGNRSIDNITKCDTSFPRSMIKLSVKTGAPGQHRNFNGQLRRSLSGSQSAVPEIDCNVTGNHSDTDTDPSYGIPGTRIMHGINGPEARRRNFSSSSLPLSLMTATIEEVDDVDYVGLPPSSHTQHAHRSHSYSGSANPTPKVPFRTLRREARVPSMNSPPRARRSGPIVGLLRSASDNTNRVIHLKDVDIVGESFKSRFPWQRDVGVQCHLTIDPIFEANAQRAMSSPAGYPYLRSLSMTSNSPPSSPIASRRSTFHNCSRSFSHSDLDHQQVVSNAGHQTANYCYYRQSLSRSNNNSISAAVAPISNNNYYCAQDSSCAAHPYNNHRADFRRGIRPRSTEVEENIRPWDISRDTSKASLEFEDDILRYLDVSENPANLIESSEEYLMRDDVLPSPPISPRVWATLEDEEYIDDSDDSVNVPDEQVLNLQKHIRRSKQPRRLSSGSITSDAESEGNEPDPPVARRGRRAAIYETKNCGDVSPTTLSPEISPSNSCDEGEGASNIAERLRRRRSSVDLSMNIYPGDLLVQEHHKKLIKRNTIADFYAGRQPNGGPLPPGVGPGPTEGVDVSKKGKQPFSLLKLMKTRSKESLTKVDEILRRLKPSEFKDNHLAAYKSLHWSDLIASSDKQQNSQTANISDTERKRREAVWELFKSECVFLIDHLMVLKHCFMEPLKKVQVEGILMYAEPQDLFGNLDELSYVSYTFCKDFIAALLKDMSITDFGRTNVLLKAFQRFSAHSRDGAVYHSYCLNYTNALTYLEKLRSNSEFTEFEKWCEQDSRCNRLQLTDLLVAPMQHCTKLPLLLHNVRKYTADEDERQQVTESIEKVETSLKQLEEKMRWIKNFERVQEIQRQIVWPTVTELDPRCVIPESLKPSLSKQPCEKLLACPKRQLLHEGQITLVETPKPLDVHMFLFDDLLLITKVKKVPRKSKQSNSDVQSSAQADRASYVVLRQPLALDRFMLHDISPSDAAASGLKHCFALVQMSRYQQITGVFTFQAACDATKSTWLTQIREAMDAYAKAASSRNNSSKAEKDPKPEEKEPASTTERGEFSFVSSRRRFHNGHSNSLRGVPTKSRSMDAVFI